MEHRSVREPPRSDRRPRAFPEYGVRPPVQVRVLRRRFLNMGSDPLFRLGGWRWGYGWGSGACGEGGLERRGFEMGLLGGPWRRAAVAVLSGRLRPGNPCARRGKWGIARALEHHGSARAGTLRRLTARTGLRTRAHGMNCSWRMRSSRLCSASKRIVSSVCSSSSTWTSTTLRTSVASATAETGRL